MTLGANAPHSGAAKHPAKLTGKLTGKFIGKLTGKLLGRFIGEFARKRLVSLEVHLGVRPNVC
jgi:hypothetical protein